MLVFDSENPKILLSCRSKFKAICQPTRRLWQDKYDNVIIYSRNILLFARPLFFLFFIKTPFGLHLNLHICLCNTYIKSLTLTMKKQMFDRYYAR